MRSECRERLLGGRYLREVVMEVGGGNPGQEFRWERVAAVVRGLVERVSCVEDKTHRIAEVAPDPSSCLAAAVGLDAAHDDLADPMLLEPSVEVDFAVKGRVDVFGDQQRWLHVIEHRLECVALSVGMQRRGGISRVVPYQDDRRPLSDETVDERPDVLLAGRVVARAPLGIVETLLDVNYDEGASRSGVGHGDALNLRLDVYQRKWQRRHF